MGTPHCYCYAVSPPFALLGEQTTSIYLTTSGSNCLQTAQSQLTVIQVPRHGEFALLGQYYLLTYAPINQSLRYCMSQVESQTCTDYIPVTGSTSRNRPNPYRPLYTCEQTAYTRGCEINPSDQGGVLQHPKHPP